MLFRSLFYSIKNNTLIFGSEIKAVLKHPFVKPTINRAGLTELFSVGPSVSPGKAVFQDISELEPAHFLSITSNYIKTKKYWSITPIENTESTSDIIEHTRFLLKDSIERQLVGDVPLCTFLSGGLDSSAISAIASNSYKKTNKKLTTYSIDYENNDKYFKSSMFQPTSDKYYANKMAKYINSDHKNIILKHETLVDALKEAVISRDLPGMADIDSSLYLFCKEVRKDFVIALSGECADEIFGGYPWYTHKNLYNANTFPWSIFVENRINILNKNYKSLKIKDYVNDRYNETLKEVPHLDNESPIEYRMKEIYYLNLKWFMENSMTQSRDRQLRN